MDHSTSPPRKRRPGVHHNRLVAAPGRCPTIPTHYPQVTPNHAPAITLPQLAALQTSLDRRHGITSHLPLIFDTGASITVTHCLDDFLVPPRPVQNTTLQGIASGLPVHGIGTVHYTVLDDNRKPITLTIPGTLYVPGCPSRLICPRQLLHGTQDKAATMTITTGAVTLAFRGRIITIPYRAPHNLPILHTAPALPSYQAYCAMTACTKAAPPVSTTSTPTHNNQSITSPPLTVAQQIKLQWHQRLNHVNFPQLTTWMRLGHLKVPQGVINAPNPVCSACQFGKAKRRSHTTCTSPIAGNHTAPGDGVSADQLEAGCPGIIPTNKGSPIAAKYHYCNIWIDHFSKYIYLTMHQRKDAKEMVHSKLRFEAFCRKHGIAIKRIRADNGIYTSQAFQASCDSQSQQLTLCGVGSHWQNGIAERCIGALQATARTILLHSMSKWPQVMNESFWPFALQHAANLHNNTSRDSSPKTPWELFTGEPPTKRLHDYHVFGSPVYVLHKALQDNPGSAPKWQSRCWQGVYLGHSSMHANSVALVYNPVTKHVTPQFHLTFDDQFSSIHPDAGKQQETIEELLRRTSWLYSDNYATPASHHHFDTTMTDGNLIGAVANHNQLTTPSLTTRLAPTGAAPSAKYKAVPVSAEFTAWKIEQGISADVFQAVHTPHDEIPEGTPSGFSSQPGLDTPTDTSEGAPLGTPLAPPIGTAGGTPHDPFTSTTTPTAPRQPSTVYPLNGIIHIAAPSPGDTLTQSAMLQADDRKDFIAAQIPEISNLHQAGVFSYHHINSLPPRAKLLNAIWSYRRKRSPSGEFRKYKARICTDGSRQQYGIDYWETYAPVVSWSTVRLLLTMSHINGWQSRQIDFTQAFTQPPIKEDVYMRIPQGWYIVDGALTQHSDPRYRDTAHYIKLEKSLYGIKQAAHTWFHHLEPGLTKLGFTASAVDPCLFYRPDCIICLYVDDCLLFSPTPGVIQSILQALRNDYLIGEEGTVQDFLGVNINTTPESHILFQQPALIQSILHDLHLIPSHPKPTPAISVLHPDHGGFARTENWNYRSLIGKLTYLAQMTRPDISMAVHNCARYSVAPTYLHEQAVKRIGRYLFATQDKGLIYNPQRTDTLDMYVDADFAGTWHKEFSHLRDCVLSRTGFVIFYKGCPIHWGSKLQTEVALSTTEAEYIALSMAARELIPIRRILRELSLGSPLKHHLTHPPGSLPPSTIYEDNASCIAVATKAVHHKPRTKHMALKYHHFRDYIQSGALQIVKVASAANLADIFTKPLTQILHEKLRFGMMGW